MYNALLNTGFSAAKKVGIDDLSEDLRKAIVRHFDTPEEEEPLQKRKPERVREEVPEEQPDVTAQSSDNQFFLGIELTEGCDILQNDGDALKRLTQELLDKVAENVLAHYLSGNRTEFSITNGLSVADALAQQQGVYNEFAIQPTLFTKKTFKCVAILRLPGNSVPGVSEGEVKSAWEQSVRNLDAISKTLDKGFKVNPEFSPVSRKWLTIMREATALGSQYKFDGEYSRIDPLKSDMTDVEAVDITEENVISGQDLSVPQVKKTKSVEESESADESTDETENEAEESSSNNGTLLIAVGSASVGLLAAAGSIAYIYTSRYNRDPNANSSLIQN